MVLNGRPLKRAKKRVTADLYDFLTFPAGAQAGFEGPFRSNVRAFLSRHARLPPPSAVLSPTASPHLLSWKVSFRIGGPKGEEGEAGEEESSGRKREDPPPSPPPAVVVDLDVVEEDVARSRSVYCDHCRVVGWSGHPVCGKRYHFIIQNDSNSPSRFNQTCIKCGSMLQVFDTRCTTCNYEMSADDLEDWAYLQLGNSSHLLHGVVHTNGYGHLLRVNGREGGSKFLTGCDIMGFWDRLCRLLRVRKVTVMDKSERHGLEYRLLHAVATGHSWYGNWGYEFGAGSFALTAHAYRKAVDALANQPLSIYFSHSRSRRTPLQDVIALYCSLSDAQLLTVRELFSFVMHLLRAADKQSSTQNSLLASGKQAAEVPCGILCTWTKDDVERLASAMVKVLRAVGGSKWVHWRALKGATSRAAGSPALLDYCLKGLGGKVTTDGMIIVVRCNSETNAIEYRLDAVPEQQLPVSTQCTPSKDQILRDLKYLYNAILNPKAILPYKPKLVRQLALESALKILDCKHFVKDYTKTSWQKYNPFAIHIWCQLQLDQPKNYAAPAELLILPITATVADLKVAATLAFCETYLSFRKFRVEQLVDYGNVADSTHVKLLLGSDVLVRVRGRWHGDHHRLGQFCMERGTENWTVDCTCGAKDDDGERMLACDVCGVWQHTRCSGIEDAQEVPAKFVCGRCSASRRPGRKCKYPKDPPSLGGGRCEQEPACSTTATIMDGGGYGCLTQVI